MRERDDKIEISFLALAVFVAIYILLYCLIHQIVVLNLV
jgi:hypothetical protein